MTGTAEMVRPLAEQFCPEGWEVWTMDAPFKHPKRGFAWWIRSQPAYLPLESEVIEQVEESVSHVLRNIPEEGPLIVGGFSQGAAIAMELLLTSIAHRIVGLVIIGSKCARPLLIYDRLLALPSGRLFSMHGERDHIVPLSQADEYADLFENAGWQVTRVRHSKGHMVDQSNAQELHDWLEVMVSEIDV